MTDVPQLSESKDQVHFSKTNNTKTQNKKINTKNETDNVNNNREDQISKKFLEIMFEVPNIS